MQIWYWRDRIKELISTEYPITKYCLDIRGNSLILVSTFGDGETDTHPFLVDLQIAQNHVQEHIGNSNREVPFCDNRLVKPSEFWIRWKSNPLALPAFDLWYDQKTGFSEFDVRYRGESNIELGQLEHTNNDCNDDFKVVLVAWRDRYGKFLPDDVPTNRFPVFFDMEQSANVLALASWYEEDAGAEDGIYSIPTNGGDDKIVFCGKNPIHVLSVERVSEKPSEYNLTKYGESVEWESGMMFDRYHYCQADGSILIPLYRFDCREQGAEQESDDGQEESLNQVLVVKMYMVVAQTMKIQNYVSCPRIRVNGPNEIDLNRMDGGKPLFGHRVKVCRNTNVAFCPYNYNGMNKVRISLLGVFVDGQKIDSHGESSCDAKTRYELDSSGVLELSMLKGKYFDRDDEKWGNIQNDKRKYIDQGIAEEFNSYDSLDKYALVLDLIPSADNTYLFNNLVNSGSYSGSAYNILGDAGYIPHFAYQSVVKYPNGDDGGTAYTWKNKFLAGKNHMQFELLGIDDLNLPVEYDFVQKMVVDDLTDNCKTIICPAKFMDDIYRVWCCSKGVKRELLPGEDDPYGYKAKYDAHFENEYKQYVNDELRFTNKQGGVLSQVEWTIPDSDLFTVDLPDDFPQTDGELTPEVVEEYRKVLEDYYITVLRAEDGIIQNEKRYILPPTPITEFMFKIEAGDQQFSKCKLSPYQSANVKDGHFVQTQVVFTGTQNPFSYDENGEKIHSREEELQYGNGICGVDSMYISIDLVSKTVQVKQWIDDFKKDIEPSTNRQVVKMVKIRQLKPTIKFVKYRNTGSNLSLIDKINNETCVIPKGEVMVILSHKNVDNLAKYHILSRSSNLFFYGSLPDNANQIQHDGFVTDRSIRVRKYLNDDSWYASTTHDENDIPYLDFNVSSVYSKAEDGRHVLPATTPPYFVEDANGDEWVLQQGKDYPDNGYETLEPGVEDNGKPNDVWMDGSKTYVENGDERSMLPRKQINPSDVVYKKPGMGDFVWAHRVVDSRPQKYIDYLYVKNGALSFKVSEESWSFADVMSKIPPYYIDVQLRNKMQDLNDLQVLQDYSTFIHQSEEPNKVKDCGAFNPLHVDAVLNYGLLGRDGGQEHEMIMAQNGQVIELDNLTEATRLKLQLEDGEIDDYLKIYTNYVRVDDGHGDWHYDLYFNVQNLFNSPFEYISSVTNQPNVLIIPDSYLYLTGDKFVDMGDHNEIDESKLTVIRKGGTLSIYGQVKTYSDSRLCDVRTIKLFSYSIHNISDDKPKFLIEKTYDITKATIQPTVKDKVEIEFSDVMWTIPEEKFEKSCDQNFMFLKEDVVVVQPMRIMHNWSKTDDNRIIEMSFDISNDIIDFGMVPELCGYPVQERTVRDGNGKPYYDHWSDRYMKLETNKSTGVPRLTIRWDENCGYNFENVFLRWRLPTGFRMMDTVDRLLGYTFSTSAENIHLTCKSSLNQPQVEVKIGHVVPRVESIGNMYLGLEHSTTLRRNGYVLKNLSSVVMNALIEENEILATAGNAT